MARYQQNIRHTSAWQRLRAQRLEIARRHGEPCGICGNPIDYSLSGAAKMGPTIDHIQPIAYDGDELPTDLNDLRVAHRSCNSRAGAKISNSRRQTRARTPNRSTTPHSLLDAPAPTPLRPVRRPPLSMYLPSSSAPAAIEHPRWWPEDLRKPPEDATLPRLETPHHSRAVGTYGPLLTAHAASYGLKLRWWQAYAHARILEHDKDGILCWPEAAVSVARQVGKGYGGIRPLAEWRMSAADVFGEPQTVLHLAHQVNTVMEIAFPAIARHRALGNTVRMTNGEQGITLDDGSRWLMRSSEGAYGFSVSMPLIDEVWAIKPRVIDSMVSPTMVERLNPQLVMWSTANAEATLTYPVFREVSGEDEGALLLEWSPDTDTANSNPGDPRVWRMASPHWTEQRQRMVARQFQKAALRDFLPNWLNVWPDVVTTSASEYAMAAWGALAHAHPAPPRGGIVAIDQSRDGTHFGVLRLVADAVYYQEVQSLQHAVAWANAADYVIVGLTWEQAAIKAGIRHNIIKYGARNTAAYTPLLMQVVASGRLAHDHHPSLMDQAASVVVADSESGKTLSAKRSGSEILGPKLLAWALGYETSVMSLRPAVW